MKKKEKFGLIVLTVLLWLFASTYMSCGAGRIAPEDLDEVTSFSTNDYIMVIINGHARKIAIGNILGTNISIAVNVTNNNNTGIGSILSWTPGSSGDPDPTIWQYCDGTAVTDPTSTLFGQLTPNLNTNHWVTTNTQAAVFGGGLTNFGVADSNWEAANSPADGWTILNGEPNMRIRQNGYVTGIGINISASTNQIQPRLYRYYSSDGLYHLVSSGNWLTNATSGSNYYTMVNPLGPCIEGDYVGIYMKTNTAGVNPLVYTKIIAGSGLGQLIASGDVATSSSFPNIASNSVMQIKVYMNPPVYSTVGDSILAGWYGYRTWIDTTFQFSGNPTNQVSFQLWNLYGIGGYGKNYSRGSQLWDYGSVTALGEILRDKPLKIIAGFGINDIINFRSWSDVQTNLTSIRSQYGTTNQLYITEIPPWACSDAQALTVRQWNTNIAVWCLTNSAICIKSHDTLASTRASTGQLDNLNPTYDGGDGIHLNAAGINAYAKRVSQYAVEANQAVYFLKIK